MFLHAQPIAYKHFRLMAAQRPLLFFAVAPVLRLVDGWARTDPLAASAASAEPSPAKEEEGRASEASVRSVSTCVMYDEDDENALALMLDEMHETDSSERREHQDKTSMIDNIMITLRESSWSFKGGLFANPMHSVEIPLFTVGLRYLGCFDISIIPNNPPQIRHYSANTFNNMHNIPPLPLILRPYSAISATTPPFPHRDAAAVGEWRFRARVSGLAEDDLRPRSCRARDRDPNSNPNPNPNNKNFGFRSGDSSLIPPVSGRRRLFRSRNIWSLWESFFQPPREHKKAVETSRSRYQASGPLSFAPFLRARSERNQLGCDKIMHVCCHEKEESSIHAQ